MTKKAGLDDKIYRFLKWINTKIERYNQKLLLTASDLQTGQLFKKSSEEEQNQHQESQKKSVLSD